VQPIERIDDKFVVFSEGNLISNQSPEAGLPASSQDGLIALLLRRQEWQRARPDVSYVPVNHPDFSAADRGCAQEGEGTRRSCEHRTGGR
jgi:poly-gamma-glutamate capsule biosynthesis protein CapA/YwtB (metallophosphatase superfamily)